VGMPVVRPGRPWPSLCAVGAGVSRPWALACAAGGAPRPERPTMTSISVRLVARGDGEDDVSMPDRQAEGLVGRARPRL